MSVNYLVVMAQDLWSLLKWERLLGSLWFSHLLLFTFFQEKKVGWDLSWKVSTIQPNFYTVMDPTRSVACSKLLVIKIQLAQDSREFFKHSEGETIYSLLIGWLSSIQVVFDHCCKVFAEWRLLPWRRWPNSALNMILDCSLPFHLQTHIYQSRWQLFGCKQCKKIKARKIS